MIVDSSHSKRNDISRYHAYFVIGCILFCIFLYFQITNNGLMIWYGDSFEQQLMFYIGGWEKFHNLDFSLWNWSLGLGANYLSYVFYFASSPFFFLTLMFPKEWIPYLFLYLNLLKIGLILIFTYHWLLNLKSTRWIALSGAIILAFSGWVIFYFHYNHFLDAFVFYPLILWLVERWICTNRFFWLTLMIGLLGITNYYFLYMFVPFIGLYSIYRLGITENQFPWKRLLTLVGIGLLGVSISACLLLPSMSLVIKTPRLTESTGLFEHISLKDLYRYVSTFFTPVMERFDPTYLISTEVHQGLGWGGGVSLNLLIITPLILPLSFLGNDRKEKAYRLCFYTLISIFVFFLIFYRLFQGSLDVRWYYMISLLNIVSLVEGLAILDNTSTTKKYLPFIGALIVGIVSLLYFISFRKQWFGSFDHVQSLQYIIFFLVLFLIIHIIILIWNRKLLWLSISLEALIVFFIPLYNDRPMDEIGLRLTNFSSTSAIDYINETDKDFYRILNDTVLYTSPNEPFAKQYKGMSFYLSLYNFEQDAYLARIKGTWSMPQTFGRLQTYNVLSTKYFITRDHTHTVPYGFDFIKRVGSEYIYQNRYYFPLGFATTKTINASAFNDFSYLNQDRILMDTIVTTNSESFDAIYFNDLVPLYNWTEPNNIEIDLLSQDQNIYIESFDIPAVTIKAYGQDSLLYDNMLFKQYTWQYNYTGIHIRSVDNVDRLGIAFNNQYQSPTLINVYLENDMTVYDDWFTNIKSQTFSDVQIDGDVIEAKLTVLSDDSWVFTSIPFDSGWKVEVDGKRIDYEKVNLGFIGFNLNNGTYDIRFVYTPPLLKMGIAVTSISFVLLVLFGLYFKEFQSKRKGLR